MRLIDRRNVDLPQPDGPIRAVTDLGSIVIDTRITYNDYVTVIFNLKVTDGQGAHLVHGRVYGSAVYLDSPDRRGVRASNADGYLRLTIDGFSTAGYRIEGVVRHA